MISSTLPTFTTPKKDITHVLVVCPFFRNRQVLKNLELEDIDNLTIVTHGSGPVGRCNKSSLIFTENLDNVGYTTFENVKKVYMYKSNVKSNYVRLYENYAWRYFSSFEEFIKVAGDNCSIEGNTVIPIKYDDEPDINLLNRWLRLHSREWKDMLTKPYEVLTMKKLEEYMKHMEWSHGYEIDRYSYEEQLKLNFSYTTKSMFIKLYNSIDSLKASIKSGDKEKINSLCNMLKIYHKEATINREVRNANNTIKGEKNMEGLLSSIRGMTSLVSIVRLLEKEVPIKDIPVPLESKVESLLDKVGIDLLIAEGCSKNNVVFKCKGKVITNKVRENYIIYDKTKVFNEKDTPYMSELWLSLSSGSLTICK